jgi:hypothetical protein
VRLQIDFARVESILAGFQLSNHRSSPFVTQS